jgi:cytoskeletal protein CcmA (bactofilin family)
MKQPLEETSVLLDKSSVLKGKITFEGICRLDGTVEGEILNSGTLIMSEAAVIKGKLGVNTLILNGKVEGEVNAKERVEIQSLGKLYGTIFTPILVIQDGGILEGDCRMQEQSNRESGLKNPGIESGSKS